MNISESKPSPLEKITFDMKMRVIFLEFKKKEPLFRHLTYHEERTQQFLTELFKKYEVDPKKGIAAFIAITEKELNATDEEIWQVNFRLIPQQILLFLMKLLP